MCETAACNNHVASRLQWETEEEPAIERAYARVTPTDEELRAAAIAEMRRRNASRPVPDPVCIKCGFPTAERDMDDIFRKECATCGINHLVDLIERIVRHKGHKKAIKALKKLARGK